LLRLQRVSIALSGRRAKLEWYMQAQDDGLTGISFISFQL
jgi:hypothetical protein